MSARKYEHDWPSNDVVVNYCNAVLREHTAGPFADLPFADQIEQLTRWAMARSGWRPDSTSWIHELAEEAVSFEIGLHVLRGCAVDLARLARDRDHVMPTEEDWRGCRDSSEPGAARRLLAYVHGHRLRLDLRFRELAGMVRQATEVPGDQLTDDALICALEAFAALGLGKSRADAIQRRLVGLPHYDHWCRDVQLHGLGIADHLPDQPDRIIALSDEMIANGEGNSDVYYWRASAERRCDEFEKALERIDRALAALPADRRESRTAYQLEREAIRAARGLSKLATTLRSGLRDESSQLLDEQKRRFREYEERQAEQIKEHRDELDDLSTELRNEIEIHSRSARQLVPDSVRGVVYLLASFAFLLSLAVVTGVQAIRADGAWLAMVWVAILLVGGTAALALAGTPDASAVGRFLRRREPRE